MNFTVPFKDPSSLKFEKDELRRRSMVRLWLYCLLLLCLAIVMIGGATRMTGSGLSITEWKPIHGVIPPINIAEWQEEFEKYQQIEQYQKINAGMSLQDFKAIYWWEWSHRFLARIIGLIALLPFLYLCLRGVLFFIKNPKCFVKNLSIIVKQPFFKIALFIPLLIGLQGLIGWWMVASGLGNSKLVSVSQYRLSLHLITACILVTILTYLARGYAVHQEKSARSSISFVSGLLVFVVLLQIYLGALVAGSHAGYVYNSWPLMNNHFIPEGLFLLKPFWLNFFENSLTIQFTHRCCAYILLILAFLHMVQTYALEPGTTHARRSILLFLLISVQALFGIITLLKVVPIQWGLIHQFFALIVLVFATAHWRFTKKLTKKSLKFLPCSAS